MCAKMLHHVVIYKCEKSTMHSPGPTPRYPFADNFSLNTKPLPRVQFIKKKEYDDTDAFLRCGVKTYFLKNVCYRLEMYKQMAFLPYVLAYVVANDPYSKKSYDIRLLRIYTSSGLDC
jgi:hypothetical protein